MRTTLAAIALGFTLLMGANPTNAASVTLYDSTSGVTPDSYNSPSPWFFFARNRSVIDTTKNVNGVTNLNTIYYTGYSNYTLLQGLSFIIPTSPVNPSFPTLDRFAGYTVSFTVQIVSQFNNGTNGPNRAGFSVIALSSDKQGIEIGFRNTDIFSQSGSSFTVGEINSAPRTSALLGALTAYNLTISGSNYTLTSGATNILNGSLRDYTAATGFASNVYRTPNFLFFGNNTLPAGANDTTSAGANVNLGSISVNTNSAAVPYNFSPTIGILTLAAWGAVGQMRKKQQ